MGGNRRQWPRVRFLDDLLAPQSGEAHAGCFVGSTGSLERVDEGAARWIPPLCPDFVLELRSPSDRLPELQDKMAEYLNNGAHLEWLIDPIERVVYVYRPGEIVERLETPGELSGEPVLPGCVLSLTAVWSS